MPTYDLLYNGEAAEANGQSTEADQPPYDNEGQPDGKPSSRGEDPKPEVDSKRKSLFRTAFPLSSNNQSTDHLTSDSKYGDRPPLLPEYLGGYSRRVIVVLLLQSLFFVAVLCGLAYGLHYVETLHIDTGSGVIDQDCNRAQTVQFLERSFYINVPAIESLSFTQAKVIDLAWDTVIGQGGRFLHGWVLYHVVASTLTWILESSALSYSFQIDMLFSTVSLMSIWASLKLVFSKQPLRTTCAAIWLTFAIGYVVAFATLWGAATGYLTPSFPAYKMPDNTYLTKDSTNLRFCFTSDDERVKNDVPSLVLGPMYRECATSLEQYQWSTMTSPLGSCHILDLGKKYLDFQNIHAYTMTKSTFANFYSISRSRTLKPLENSTTSWYDFQHFDHESGAMFGRPLDTRCASNSDGCENQGYPEGLYQQVYGWEYLTYNKSLEYSTPLLYNVRNVTFELNSSIPYDQTTIPYDQTIVPYNSTLWFGNKDIPITAPFLNFSSGCSPGHDNMGGCLCYNGVPLTQDFRQDDSLICISSPGYLWGFSSTLTRISLALELCWIIGCFLLWLLVHMLSIMVKSNRTRAGVTRNILDIGTAITRDLGDKTGSYTESELTEALKTCQPVGYAVEEANDIDRIRLVSVPEGPRFRRKFTVDSGKRYG